MSAVTCSVCALALSGSFETQPRAAGAPVGADWPKAVDDAPTGSRTAPATAAPTSRIFVCMCLFPLVRDGWTRCAVPPRCPAGATPSDLEFRGPGVVWQAPFAALD